ncbi:MAG TPA: serine/threonine-protein kinase [Polyangiaceae bacterium]
MLGETLAQRFLLEHELGRGGMGVVYRAVDKWNGAPCAVKVLTRNVDPRRFFREARVLSRLTHPAIVRYVAHGVSPAGELFLAMEWVNGADLASRLQAGPLSIGETLELGERLAEALAAVHAADIVHRDLKPSNVLLPEGRFELAKLGDFGVSLVTGGERSVKTTASKGTLTKSGAVVGTPGYLAPEQLRGGTIDAQADLFSLGCILHECLAGHPAFYAESMLALAVKIAVDPTPGLRERCPALPVELERLIFSLLEKQAAARPPSALSVLATLREARNVAARHADDAPRTWRM